MGSGQIILKDFRQVATLTWLVLVIYELYQAGAVQRFVNLEYYFYFLFFLWLIEVIAHHK